MSTSPSHTRRPSPAPTGSSGYVRTLVQTIDAFGGDGLRLAREVGIDEAALRDPRARIPFQCVRDLWLRAPEAAGNPAIGLHFAENLAPGSLGGLLVAFLTSETLKDAAERLIRYWYLVSDIASMRIEEHPDSYRLVFTHPHDPDTPPGVTDALASSLVLTARSMFPARELHPVAVELMRPEPADTRPYEDCFRAPVRYGTTEDAVRYTRADMEAPVPEHNAELARASDAVAARALEDLGGGRVSDRVYASILTSLPAGAVSEGKVARRLGLSRSSLARQLKTEGVTFRTLLDEVRSGLARGYLTEATYSIKEIAYLLGFADVASFSRAFKRWTGVSPTAYATRQRRR